MKHFLFFLPVILLVFSCIARADKEVAPPKEVPVSIKIVADSVVRLLEKKDYEAFMRVIHPEKEVRLTPYLHIDAEHDIWLSGKLEWIPTDGPVVLWGNYDGSGEPIFLTIDDYMDKFVTDADYLGKGEKLINATKSRGNSVDNLTTVYPQAEYVEYYIPGTEENSGMDWRSLRLVFERHEGQWKLVGIIHGSWTV
jgi:hypothetical protein